MLAVYCYFRSMVDRITDQERGATAAEYGLLLAGVAVLITAAIFALGGRIDALFDGITFTAPAGT